MPVHKSKEEKRKSHIFEIFFEDGPNSQIAAAHERDDLGSS
jgi:hypothetical protein